jgi:hypothetical protein
MQINVTFDQSIGSLPTGFVTAIDYVVNYYDSLFTNNVTINIDVGYGEIGGQSLESSALGENEPNLVPVSYSSVRSALQAQGAPGASTLPSSSPLSSGSLYITQAEAQALGLYPNNGSLDAYVGFTSAFSFSYSATAKPASNQYYFIGVAEHEISELMGRMSMLDQAPTPMDLYRYSSPGVRDLTTGGTGSSAYFSINNGTTNLGTWNNQTSNGDLGDWYPQGPAPGGNDAYNDYSNPGVINVVSANDITLMQALGWTTSTTQLSQGQGPTVTSVIETPSTADLNAGKTVTITLALSEAVIVAGGTPTLTLNDGGTATYTGGSGTDVLTFSYTVGANDSSVSSVSSLAVQSINLNGGTIADGAGNNATLSLSGLAQSGPQIETAAPTAASISATTDNKATDVNAGHLVTITVTTSESVTVTGTLTLQLNDHEVATYTKGSGTNALTFTYTVQPGDNVTDLQVTGLNMPSGSTIQDAAGNNLSGGVTGDLGLQIDTTPPVVAISSTGGLTNHPTQTVSGTVDVADAGTVVTLFDGTVALGTATVKSNGSWSDTITLTGDGTHSLTAKDTDAAGNTGISNAVIYTLDTVAPTEQNLVATVDNHTTNVNAGHLVTITMTTDETVTVIGTPTLQLNDNEAAFYTGGSGTNTLTFTYAVQPGDNVADLHVTGLNVPSGATIEDQAGNPLSGSVTADLGLQINTMTVAPTSLQQEVLGLYAALYNRAADFGSYSYWVNTVGQQADEGGVTTANAGTTAVTTNDAAALGQLFVNTQSSYFNSVYGGLSDSAFINAMYVNIGGNAGDPTGVAYWASLLQQAEAGGQSVQAARAGLVGQFVHDLIDINLATATGLTSAQLSAAEQRQETIDNKIAVSEYLSNASQQPGGSILVAHTVGDPAYQAATTVLQGVTYDPATVTAAIVGINNAVAHQDLLLI